MSGPLEEHNIREYLMAFADGELDAAENLSVLEYLAEHPDALELMRSQQRLRIAAGHAARTLTPAMPEALRRRIEELAATVRPATASPARRSWWSAFRGPLLAVAATFLVAGLLVGRLALPPKTEHVVAEGPLRTEPPVPVSLVVHASRVHAGCSRLDAALHAASIPKEMGGLSEAIKKELGGENPYPDFSHIGYRYIGAGPCGAPLSDTLHLLYYSTGPGPRTAISVFVQSHHGQFQLDPGKLYILSDDRSAFPLFAWRTEEVVYFLLADTPQIAEAARNAMAGAPRPPAVSQ